MPTPTKCAKHAGRYPADWAVCRRALVVGGEAEAWRSAFQDYFLERLNLRYLHPIAILQEHGTFQGEGFSILALHCSLVEFLESTIQGLNYRCLRRGEQLGQFEYGSSKEMFVSFLCARPPFNKVFDDVLADEFYGNIRCALLHEARTKGGWKIWAKSPDGMVVDRTRRIVFRDDFQEAINQFIRWYKDTLPCDATLQKGFIRKFDSLCE